MLPIAKKTCCFNEIIKKIVLNSKNICVGLQRQDFTEEQYRGYVLIWSKFICVTLLQSGNQKLASVLDFVTLTLDLANMHFLGMLFILQNLYEGFFEKFKVQIIFVIVFWWTFLGWQNFHCCYLGNSVVLRILFHFMRFHIKPTSVSGDRNPTNYTAGVWP